MPEASPQRSHGAPPGPANAGARALARAVEAGDAAEVARLAAAGAAADVPSAGGETPLMRAAAKGHADVARALLDAGADANARRGDGFTPLLVAAFRGHADVARVLLERGADASARTRLGAGAGEWAASHGFTETAALLREATTAKVGASKIDERRADGNNGRGAEVAVAQQVFIERPQRESAESLSSELFASAGAAGPVEVRRRRAALPVAVVLAAVALTAVALYAFVWRAKPSSGGRPADAPPGGASNVVPQPAPQTQPTAMSAQPAPSVTPPDATGMASPNGAPPVIITMPADGAPVGGSAMQGQTTVRGGAAPLVVNEGGATSATDPKAARADAQRKGEARGEETRAGEEAPRASPGQGAEIRTAAPARPYVMPPANSSAPPSPEPSPKRKVIQWP